ncbi:MAG: hypothetical protein IJI22_04755 [Bacilli bacterium]|nr:hypothetical protein [Bacilli bacterium]
MNIEELISKMTIEEKEVFQSGTASEYYEYVIEEFALKEKIQNIKNIDEDSFNFILEKLYLVVGKAVLEDGDYTFGDEVLKKLVTKLMRSRFTSEPVSNECYKFINYLEALKKGIEINEDLLDGHDVVLESGDVNDLKTLYGQHEEANLFRTNYEYFIDLYESVPSGVIDVNLRSAIYAMNNAYEREKELVKKYEK